MDEGFEAGIALDIHLVELDAVRPGEGPVEEVVDLLGRDVDDDGLMVGLRHQLLAEVRSDEAATADHAYRQHRNRVSVQVHSRHWKKRNFVQWEREREGVAVITAF